MSNSEWPSEEFIRKLAEMKGSTDLAAVREEFKQVMQAMDERDTTLDRLRPCSLEFYAEIAGKLPRPTPSQVEDFVQFVTEARDWGGLPFLPPGAPFVFFMDPMAGFDRAILKDGKAICKERAETRCDPSENWPDTAEYWERYGYLAFSSPGWATGGRLIDGNNFIVQLPVGFTTENAAYRLPDEAIEAGAVEMTALLSPSACSNFYWGCRNEEELAKLRGRWPSETGGDAAMFKVVEVCKQHESKLLALDESTGKTDDEVVQEMIRTKKETREALEMLFRPERLRLQKNMADAINQMLCWLYEG